MAVLPARYVPITDDHTLDGLHPGYPMLSVIHTKARKIARCTKSILSGEERERDTHRERERAGKEETNGAERTGRGQWRQRRRKKNVSNGGRGHEREEVARGSATDTTIEVKVRRRNVTESWWDPATDWLVQRACLIVCLLLDGWVCYTRTQHRSQQEAV